MEPCLSAPRLSVVIVNWNGEALLAACLEPLIDPEFQVIVVDNASSDGSIALLDRHFPTVQVISNTTNRGFAAANNQGLEAATAPVVLFLNNDTAANRLALVQLVEFLEGHPAVSVAGPSLVFPDGSPQRSCGRGPSLGTELLGKTMLHRLLPGIRDRAPTATCRVDWVTGAALGIRRDLARALGGWEEAMFMFYEDLDLCARAREAGSEVWFVSTAPIIHIGGASRRRVEADSLVHSYQSTDLFFAKHGPSWRRHLVRAITLPEMALRMAVWSGMLARRDRRGLARERLRAYRRILRLASPTRRR